VARPLSLLALLAAGALALAAPAASAAAPQVKATWVENVTATSADLKAEIDPGGVSTSYRFDYLTQAAYDANVKAAKDPFAGASKAPLSGAANAGAGSVAVSVTQHIAKLQPTTLYRFRAVATNTEGTTIGPERSLGTQAPTNAFSLLDGRGWEMVSPIEKNGGAIQPPEEIFGGGVFQAAANGQSLTYSSVDSFGAPQGAPAGSQYIATRASAGWTTQNITIPLESGGYGDKPNGVPYQLFSPDLARGLLLNPRRCAEGEGCPRGYSLRESKSGALTPSPEGAGLGFGGATPDLAHMVFSSPTGLFEAPAGLYRWDGAGGFELLSANLSARLAAASGAISSNANRVYFTQEGDLYLREGGETKQVDVAQGGGGAFQVASTDGRYALFTKAEHLYRYDANSEIASDLTPGGEVQGVLGASAEGSRVYYLSALGLYLWSAGTTTKVAASADVSNYPPATGTARVSPEGSHLLFLSSAELTGYESDGATEAFLYGPPPSGGPATLTCISCNPTGELPQGDASIPGAIANGQAQGATHAYKPRALSDDGQRAFFESADDLSIQDSNNKLDVYEWEAQGKGSCAKAGGCVQLISSGRSAERSLFLDASADGSDAFFLTDSSLATADPGSYDVYVAREGGGFPPPPNTIPCEADACQPLPEAPEDPTPGTLVKGPGNPATRFTKPKEQKQGKPKGKHHGKKKHHKRHHGKGGGKR
jgi:hypothetical protein